MANVRAVDVAVAQPTPSPTTQNVEDDEDDAPDTPEWIMRAVDRLASTIVSERRPIEETDGAAGPDANKRRRRRRRQSRATLLRWLRLLVALSLSLLLAVLAMVLLRPMAGPLASTVDGLFSAPASTITRQLALFGSSDAAACDATGALSTMQAAMQDSSELLRDAMSRGDEAVDTAATAQVRSPCDPALLPDRPRAPKEARCRVGIHALSLRLASPGSRRGWRRRSGGGARVRSCCA